MAWHLGQRNSLLRSIVCTREEWFSINKRGGENKKELKTFLAQRWLKLEDSWEDAVLVKELGQVHTEIENTSRSVQNESFV